MKPRISELESVELGTPDLAATRAFYEKAWGLEVVCEERDRVYFRGTGPRHHILVLHGTEIAEAVAINFRAADKSTVDGLYEKITAAACVECQSPHELSGPGGGYGFAFKDIIGRNLRIVADSARHADGQDVQGRARQLTHAIFNSDDSEQSSAFFIDVLGFKLTDKTKGLDFLRCNDSHHSVGIARTGGATLNHIAYEMPDWESIMYGAGRLKEHGCPVEWGIGRHGPGDNIFSYYVGPDDVAIEFTADVEKIDDATHKVRGPDHWPWMASRHEQWGLAGPPSEALKKAFKHLPFAAELPGG